jgi:Lipopolysaccharide kinase (Kdo/WaaP) family
MTDVTTLEYRGMERHAVATGATDPVDALSAALDQMHDAGEKFMGRFALRGFLGRRVGGQGVVQFAQVVDSGAATDAATGGAGAVVIKFFTDENGYDRELGFYAHPALRGMLPEVVASARNDDGTVMSSRGFVFPPCLIVEKGESLDEWAARVAPDFPTSMCVLCHVAARLAQLHAAGFAHGDLKPANILWRPRANAWTLIDFGCTAEIGARHRVVALVRARAGTLS